MNAATTIVGHPTVTERAYERTDLLGEAVRFAEATTHNGLGLNHLLSRKELLRLKAQIERDFLVAIAGREAA